MAEEKKISTTTIIIAAVGGVAIIGALVFLVLQYI